MRPALVFGALGQDGSLLMDRLARDGVPAIGIIRPGSMRPGGAVAALRELDLADASAVDAVIAGLAPSRIFYLAAAHHSAESAPEDRVALWPAMTTVNCLGVVHTMRAILRRAPDCRLIFAASSQMYTAADDDLRIDETTARQPRTFYGQTKSWSFDAIAFARTQEGLKGATAILCNHESPRRPPTFITRKITRAAAAIRLGRERSVTIADLGGRADWSDAEDVVDALVRMAEQPAPQDYVIGSGTLHSIEQLAECAFRRVGLDWRDHVTAAARRQTPVVYADPRRIQADLGWQPRRSFEALIHAMVDADLAALERGA